MRESNRREAHLDDSKLVRSGADIDPGQVLHVRGLDPFPALTQRGWREEALLI